MKDLIEIRKKIDKTDKKLILLLKERFELSKLVGELKIKKGLPALDAERWKSLLEDRIKFAKKNNISEKMINAIYSAIHSGSLEIQNKLIEEKEE